MPEIEVNGKKVVIRESFPAGEFHDLPKLWANSDEMEFRERAAMFARFIESWEFDGAPDDVEAWEAMDIFREVAPIQRHINQFVIGLFTDAKN